MAEDQGSGNGDHQERRRRQRFVAKRWGQVCFWVVINGQRLPLNDLSLEGFSLSAGVPPLGSGAFPFVLQIEGVPDEVSAMITAALDVPTIGIGAGPRCDGQVLVMHDLLGIEDRLAPKFVRRYADLRSASVEAIAAYAADVRTGAFPSADESYHLTADQAEAMALYGSTS